MRKFYKDTNLEIEDTGKVYQNGKERKLLLTDRGYVIVKYQYKALKVSRLVLETFHPIDNCEAYHAHHLDHNPLNNNLDNLIWLSPYDHLSMEKSKEVCVVSEGKEYMMKFKSRKEAADFVGGDARRVCEAIASGKLYKGYYFLDGTKSELSQI